MKKMLSILISTVVLFAASAVAVDLTCQWKANPPNELVSSYVVEIAKDSPNFTNFVPVITVSGNQTNGIVRGITQANTPNGCKLRVVAKNIKGSSGPSNTDTYPKVVPTVPVQFNITNP